MHHNSMLTKSEFAVNKYLHTVPSSCIFVNIDIVLSLSLPRALRIVTFI